MNNLKSFTEQIKGTILSAESKGFVTNYNWNETLKNKNIVAFGLGKFMEDTHERLFKMLPVKYLSDNNSQLWGGG